MTPILPSLFALFLTFVAACAPQQECTVAQALPSREAVGVSAEQGRPNVLMLPPNSACPRTGGERNMDFFARGLHGLGCNVHIFTPQGPLSRLYDGLGIPNRAPGAVRVAERNVRRFRHKADAIETIMDPAVRCDGDAECAAERTLHLIEPLMAELETLLLPQDVVDSPAMRTLTLARLGISPRLQRALHLRLAAQQVDADVVFADLGRDAEAAVLGLVGTRRQVLWYQQMTEPEPRDRFLARHARIVTCGEGVRLQRFTAESDVVAVPNGIDTERFVKASGPRPELLSEGGTDALVIGNVATVETRKNQRLLIQAVGERIAELGNVHVYFFGRLDLSDRNTYLQEMLALADTLGIADRIHFVGSHEDIEKYVPHFDIFVLPSLVEGMPLALLEAMSSEVAAVASDIPATQEMAGEGVAFFSLKQPHTLGDRLVALAQDPAGRRRMGKAGRATVLQRRFTIEAMLHNMFAEVGRAAMWPAALTSAERE